MNPVKQFRYVNAAGAEIVLDAAHGFLLDKPEGVDTLSVQVSSVQGPGRIGSTVESRSVQPRPVVLSGTLCGVNQNNAKELLQSVIRPDMTGALYADDFYLDVVVTSSPAIGALRRHASFQFQLLAPYPYWQCRDRRIARVSGMEKSFRFPWNISRAYAFGRSFSVSHINVRNEGQVDCPFRVRIAASGVAENFTLENLLTGEFLTLEKELADGEEVVIDIGHGRTTVMSSVDGDCRGALSLASNLTRLHVGDNLLHPGLAADLGHAAVTIEYAAERLGVIL